MHRQSRWLLAILLFSLLLNTWGITWGLPDRWHPDELTQRAENMVGTPSLNPHFFAYRGFHHYMIALCAVLPVKVPNKLLHLFDYDTQSTFVVTVSRLLSALMGTGVVLITFLIGESLFDRRSGLFAAALLATSMLLVNLSHFATVGVPSLFQRPRLASARHACKHGKGARCADLGADHGAPLARPTAAHLGHCLAAAASRVRAVGAERSHGGGPGCGPPRYLALLGNSRRGGIALGADAAGSGRCVPGLRSGAGRGGLRGAAGCLARDSAAGWLSGRAVRPPDLWGEASRRRARARQTARLANRPGEERRLKVLSAGEAAVLTSGSADAALFCLVASWRTGRTPLYINVDQGPGVSSDDAYVLDVAEPQRVIEELALRLGSAPGAAAVILSPSARAVDLLFEAMPTWGRIVLAGPSTEATAIDFYNHVHHKGVRLLSVAPSSAGMFDPALRPQTERNIERAHSILGHDRLAARCLRAVA